MNNKCKTPFSPSNLNTWSRKTDQLKTVKNLHESTIKMLLFMSAMDDETLPTDLTHSCKQFITSKTTALAEQEFDLQFENHGMTKVSFMMGYISNMYHGLLL